MTESTLAKTREVALTSPLIFGQTISSDAHTTLVLVRLNQEVYQDAAEVERLRDFVERTARGLMEPVGVKVRMTGTPAVRVEVIRSTTRDLLLYGGAAIGTVLVVGMVLLRSIVMPLAALATAALGLFWMLGFAGLADIPLNVMTIDLIIVLGFTTSAGALFAQMAGRRAREAGGDVAAATARSVWATGVAEIAIAAGSMCWLGSDGIGVAGLGTLSAVGALSGLAAVALVVPPLVEFMERGAPASTKPALVVGQIVGLTTARAGIIGIVALVATAGAAYAATRARPDLHLEDNLPTRGEYVDTMRHCGQAMGGVYHVAVVVRMPEGETLDSPTSEAAHRDLQALFVRTEPLKNPMSLVNVVEGMPTLGSDWGGIIRYVTNPVRPSVKMFLNLERRESIATARVADIGTDAVEAIGLRLDAGLDELRKKYPGYEFELTGMPIVAARALNGSLRKLVTVTAIGLAAAFVALAIGLRSIGGGAVVVAAGLFALAVTVGAMALPGASLNYGNVVVPQLAVAISIVCATQYVSAAQEPSGSIPSPSLALWGSTAALLMPLAGSSVFLASEIYARRAFGASCCIALAAALVAQWVIVPAFTRLLIRGQAAPSAN